MTAPPNNIVMRTKDTPGRAGHPREVVEEAFALFAQNIPKETIAEKVGVDKKTIYAWMEKFQWEQRKARLDELLQKRLDESTTDIRLRQVRIIRGVIGSYLERLKAGTVKPNTQDLIAALKHELHLVGVAESSVEMKGMITLEMISMVLQQMRKEEKIQVDLSFLERPMKEEEMEMEAVT